MKTCQMCQKHKKRKKVRYTVFSYYLLADDETIKKSGFLCKKCIKKLKFDYYPF